MERTVKIYDPLKCRREEYRVKHFQHFDAFLENIMELMGYLPGEKCHTRLYLKNPDKTGYMFKYINNMNEISEETDITVILLNLFDLGRGRIRFTCNLNDAPVKIPRWHDILGKLEELVRNIDDKYSFEPADQYEDMIECILSNVAICKSLDVICKSNDDDGDDDMTLGEIPNYGTEDDVDDAVEEFHDFYDEQIFLLRKKLKKAIDIHRVIHLLKHDAPKEIQVSEENTVKITMDILRHVKDESEGDFGPDGDGGYKLKKLGKGGFGSVSKCTFHGGIVTVIKCMQFYKTCDGIDQRNIFYKEIRANRLLESTSHQNIIEYFKPALVFDNWGYIVMEYGGVSIESQYLKHKQMEDIDILKAVNDVSHGLHYLHTLTNKRSKYVVHRDIRTANIVLNEHGIYKIIDFGISTLTTKLNSRIDADNMKLGNYYWKSPELLHVIPDPEKDPGRMVDIWSLGVSILEMKAFPELPECIKENLNGGGDRKSRWIKNIKDEKWIPKQIKDKWREEIRVISEKCLQYDESKRCGAQALFEITSDYIEIMRKQEFKMPVAPGDKLPLTVLGDKQITVTSDMLKKISQMQEGSSDVDINDCACTISMIASGAFATAVRCTYSNVGVIVMKYVKLAPDTKEKLPETDEEKEKAKDEEEKIKTNKDTFDRELKCAIELRGLNHKNIVQCFLPLLVYDDKFGFTLQEYGGTSVEELYWLKKPMDDCDIDKAIRDIANGLHYLHTLDENKRKYIIHRDIRAANIVVDKIGPDGVYKLIDFGISSKTTDISSRICSKSLELGNPYWKSPEFCYHETLKVREVESLEGVPKMEKPGRLSDMWSFGIFILEMKSYPKYPDFINHCENCKITTNLFMEGLLRISLLKGCNELYDVRIKNQIERLWKDEGAGAPNVHKQIISNCLKWYEEDRYTAEAVLATFE